MRPHHPAVRSICAAALLALLASAQSPAAGPGKYVGKLLGKALPDEPTFRLDDPAGVSRLVVRLYGDTPYSVAPLVRTGKVPRYGLRIPDLEANAVASAVQDAAFEAELALLVRRALPRDGSVDAVTEAAVLDRVSALIKPAVVRVLTARPDIPRKIWINLEDPARLGFIADELMQALTVASRNRDPSLKVSGSVKGVYLEFVRGVQVGRTEFRLEKIEVIKPTVLASGIALCAQDATDCTEAVADAIRWIGSRLPAPAQPRALAPEHEAPIDRPGGGIGGLEALGSE
jgi:hypothetical protein